MTGRQREVLAVMLPNAWIGTPELANACRTSLSGLRPLLGRLEESGHVLRRGGEWMLSPKGLAVWRRAAPPEERRPRRRLKARPFTAAHSDPASPRYGQLFMIVRVMRCWLDREGYRDAGHYECGRGVQGGHTAHHVGRLDADGLIPGCGAAHDLYAGLGGEETLRIFRRWLREGGATLAEIGQGYVEDARAIAARGRWNDQDMAP